MRSKRRVNYLLVVRHGFTIRLSPMQLHDWMYGAHSDICWSHLSWGPRFLLLMLSVLAMLAGICGTLLAMSIPRLGSSVGFLPRGHARGWRRGQSWGPRSRLGRAVATRKFWVTSPFTPFGLTAASSIYYYYLFPPS